MGSDQLKSALQNANEVELTVTGRKSGRESSRPLWFVEEGEKLLLLPISGSDSNWYRNIVKTPEIRLTADGAELAATATTIDADGLADVVGKFEAKYGADQVEKFYPKRNAAVEVPLS